MILRARGRSLTGNPLSRRNVGCLSDLRDYELGESELEVEALQDAISQINGSRFPPQLRASA